MWCRIVIEYVENILKKEILEFKNYIGGIFYFVLINKVRKVFLIWIFYYFNCFCVIFSYEEVVFCVYV